MKLLIYRIFYLLILSTALSCSQTKLNGVSLVSPPKPIDQSKFLEIKEINASWVSVIPYALSKGYTTDIQFNSNYQWWGETKKGVLSLINMAKNKKLKVMLKPHVWFRGGAATDFVLSNNNDWKVWEKNYTDYILFYAKIAQEQHVDLFCFSTELKQVVLKRPQFFSVLIKKIKEIYKGKLTYAANWDNYKQVNFWNELDFIGVDAYYPLSEKKQPSISDLNTAWLPIKKQLQMLSIKYDKPILFTEYGFESCDYNTKNTWGSQEMYPKNEKSQANAYQSLYDTFYKEYWFAGGFLWKWHLTESTKRNIETSFTPQGKLVMEIVKNRFKK